MHDPATLVELLSVRSAEQAGQEAYAFLTDGETDSVTITHAELDRQARCIAALLQASGVKVGDRAVLLYAPGLDYIAGYFGCLYAGVVAVPAYPPDPGRLSRTLPRVQAIAADAKASVVMTTTDIHAMAEIVFGEAPELESLKWIATDDVTGVPPELWRPPAIRGDTLAFLQYTSGSTGAPRGVMLTHANLLSNAKVISSGFEISDDSRGVSWLPPYHDMGLIGGILQPLYVGRPTTLLSPLAFLQRPLRWLRAISMTRGTISGAPNFAFDLCVRKATDDDIETLDLSCWVTAFCGAEPVRAETLERFEKKFAPCGFQRTAFYPCYGLAEATLMVSGGSRAAAPTIRRFTAAGIEAGKAIDTNEAGAAARTLVSCGRAQAEHLIAIVDPETGRRTADGRIGEIWISGPSVAKGYWQLPADTEQTFGGRLPDDPRPFLRSGDLGFLHDGELFVTGRLKDMIIIRGRNCYPQDIELTVEKAHIAMRPGCGAAFAVDAGGEERLIVVQELERRYRAERRVRPRPELPGSASDRRQPDPMVSAFSASVTSGSEPPELDGDDIIQSVRQAVAEQHQLDVGAVVLVKAGTISKTSSGKVQRHACRRDFVGGQLSVLHEWRNRTLSGEGQRTSSRAPSFGPSAPPPPEHNPADVTNWLVMRLAKLVRVSPREIDPGRPITRFGLDSLQSVELQNEIETHLGVVIPAAQLLAGPTIVELAGELLVLMSKGPEAPIEPAPPNARKVLSFAQERMWFLHQLDPKSASYNMGASIRWRGPLDEAILARALNEIVRRHEVLRTTFTVNKGRPVPVVAPFTPAPVSVVDLTAEPVGNREAAARRAALGEAQRPFDLTAGPVHRWTLLRLGADDHVLLAVMHHIAGDGWSINVLIRELGALYDAFSRNEPSPLPDLAIQYGDYAHWERGQLDGPAMTKLIAFWKQELIGAPESLDLPFDRPRLATQTFRGARYTLTIERSVVDALHAISRRDGVTFFMTLLAAFNVLLSRYTAETDLVTGCVTANRNRAQLESLIGFFANTLAVRVKLPEAATFRDLLRVVSAATLRAYAHQDLPFERLVAALGADRDLTRIPLVQVVFVLQNTPPPIAAPGVTTTTAELDTQAARFDLLVEAWETDAGLVLSFEYATDLFEEVTMMRLARHYEGLLDTIATRPDATVAELAEAIPVQMLTIGVTATFTAEPLDEPLRLWLNKLRIPAVLRFSPYNQVFQQLLDPESILGANEAGLNLILLRLEDWGGASNGTGGGDSAHDAQLVAAVEQNVAAFLAALETHRRVCSAPCVVGICPPSDRVAASDALSRRLGDIAATLSRKLRAMKSVYALDLNRRLAVYGVRRINDPYTDELGHVPYSEGAFSAMSACIARRIFALGAPYRAVVVDADGVLWSGAAARPAEIRIEPMHRHVQELLARLRSSGFRLCLSNKGDEAQVFDVFKRNPEMPIMLRHFHSWRIHDDAAASSVVSLADELRLGLSQMVFLSADPARRADVRGRCPEVIVIEPPANAAELPQWIDHLWAFYPEDGEPPAPPRPSRVASTGTPNTPTSA